MASSSRKLFFLFDWPLLISLLCLLALGLVNLYSATASSSGQLSPFFRSQLTWTFLGLGVLLASLSFHYRHLITLAWPFYILCLILLALVPFLGEAFGGQQNWLVLGPVRLQPSELAKLAVILMLSRHYAKIPAEMPIGFKDHFKALLIMAFPLGLILWEKDLGAAVFFVLIGISFLFFAGLKKRYLVIAFLFLGLCAVAGYQFFLKDYQKARIQTFLHPEQDPRGRGYHLLQSKIAVGSGQFSGKGFQEGQIHRLKFLPERHTDFVFPVLAEEWGLVGSWAVLGVFGMFFLFLMHSAGKVPDPFGAFFIAGVGAWLFWQWTLNLGGVLGLLPLAGVTLPFFSYGGSALLTNLLALGLAMNIYMRRYVF